MSHRAKVAVGLLAGLLVSAALLAVWVVPALANAAAPTRNAIAVYVGAVTALITFAATVAAAVAAIDSRQAATESRNTARWALEALARHDAPEVEFSVTARPVTEDDGTTVAVAIRLIHRRRAPWRGVSVRLFDQKTGTVLLEGRKAEVQGGEPWAVNLGSLQVDVTRKFIGQVELSMLDERPGVRWMLTHPLEVRNSDSGSHGGFSMVKGPWKAIVE